MKYTLKQRVIYHFNFIYAMWIYNQKINLLNLKS